MIQTQKKNLKLQDRVSSSLPTFVLLTYNFAPEKCRNHPKKPYPPFSKLLHVHTLSDTRSVVGLPCHDQCKSYRWARLGGLEEPEDSRSRDRSSNYHACRRTSGKILRMEGKKLGQRCMSGAMVGELTAFFPAIRAIGVIVMLDGVVVAVGAVLARDR